MQNFTPDRLLINRITYVASLVSNLKDVDPMLDTLREVTATILSNTHLISLGRSPPGEAIGGRNKIVESCAPDEFLFEHFLPWIHQIMLAYSE